jgi:nicotinamidase-related amidase
MTTPTYDPKMTAVLLVDPYNDFLSEGGKLWPVPSLLLRRSAT